MRTCSGTGLGAGVMASSSRPGMRQGDPAAQVRQAFENLTAALAVRGRPGRLPPGAGGVHFRRAAPGEFPGPGQPPRNLNVHAYASQARRKTRSSAMTERSRHLSPGPPCSVSGSLEVSSGSVHGTQGVSRRREETTELLGCSMGLLLVLELLASLSKWAVEEHLGRPQVPSGWSPWFRSGSLGDRGSEPGSLVWGEATDRDALAVDLDIDVFHVSFVPAGFDEVGEFLRQVSCHTGELEDGENLGQSNVRLLNLDHDRVYAVGVLKVGLQLCGDLRRVGSGLRDAVNDYLSH